VVNKTSVIDTIKGQIKLKLAQILSAKEINLSPKLISDIQEQLLKNVEVTRTEYDSEVSSYLAKIGVLQADLKKTQTLNTELQASSILLSNENLRLKDTVKSFEDKRPKFTPEQLSKSFKDALAEIETAMNTVPESSVRYGVGAIDVELKANLSIEDQQVIIKTPNLLENITSNTISTLRFKIEKEPRIPETIRIKMPNLIGNQKVEAIKSIENLGLTLGVLSEKESLSPQMTVIDQIPEPFTSVEPGFPVSLTISMQLVTIPNLIGLTKADAEEILGKAYLKLSKVTKEPSETSPGIVISQSIKSGTKVRKQSEINIVVSSKK
jgi:hypothetical protein